jgi:hypothetical protein
MAAKAQFIQTPPLERVKQFFILVTGQPFEPLVTWSTWAPIDPKQMQWMTVYIRPCHQKVLQDVISGTAPNPCALLRQLLRPYDYYVDASKGSWTLRLGKPQKGVRVEEKEEIIQWT